MSETEDKRGRGRPRKLVKFDVQKHVFLDAGLASKLARLAQDYGLSESAVIRQLIQRYEEERKVYD